MNENITNEKIDLSRQVAIVTGGGRGIGRAIALALAKAGAKVAVAARSADQLAETLALIDQGGGRGIAVPTDVTDQQAVERMVAVTENELGPVDLLVNNAGVPGPYGPMWETDPDEWGWCMDVNLRGPYLCVRAVMPAMVTRQRGKIITVASGSGTESQPYSGAYTISKTAVIRFSEILAVEAKEHNISSFSIHPGIVHTAMAENIAASPMYVKWHGGWLGKVLADGYDAPPEQAADLALYLASGKADALSGCYISVDDDIEEMVRHVEEIRDKQLYTLRLHT